MSKAQEVRDWIVAANSFQHAGRDLPLVVEVAGTADVYEVLVPVIIIPAIGEMYHERETFKYKGVNHTNAPTPVAGQWDEIRDVGPIYNDRGTLSSPEPIFRGFYGFAIDSDSSRIAISETRLNEGGLVPIQERSENYVDYATDLVLDPIDTAHFEENYQFVLLDPVNTALNVVLPGADTNPTGSRVVFLNPNRHTVTIVGNRESSIDYGDRATADSGYFEIIVGSESSGTTNYVLVETT